MGSGEPEPFNPVTYGLVRNDLRARRTIQQSLEMKAGELIIDVFPNMRCKGCHRAGIARFQLGKGLEITLCRGICVLLGPKGFESTQCLRLTPQNQVAHRSAPELFHPRRKRCADTYARAELLVGGFEARRNVYGITVGRVVEETTTAEIADDRRPCMSTDTSDSQCDPFLLPAFAERLCICIQSQRAIDRAVGMVRLLTGGPKQHMQGVTNDLCNRTIVRKHKVGHACEIVVEQRSKRVGFERLHERGEAGNVGEQCRDLTALPAKINRVCIAGKPLGQIGREVTRKRGVRPLSLRLPPPRLA